MIISDSHTDFLTAIINKKDREIYVKDIVRHGAKNISCAVFTTEKKLTVDDMVNYADELNLLRGKYNINLLLSIEDLGTINNFDELNRLIKLKPFSVSLTWNYLNQFGGGADSKQGLTVLGKDYIKLLENKNIIVDSAHLSRKSFYDLCKISRFPIYNSHSNIYNFKRHNRNLTDSQIAKIVNSNGYLGITLYNKFVSNKEISSKDMALQFDYLIHKFGYKSFGLGTDLYGINKKNLPIDIKGYSDIYKIIKGLKSLGHSNKVIDCLIFKNFEDFMSKITT